MAGRLLTSTIARVRGVLAYQNRQVDVANRYGSRQERAMFAIALVAIAAVLLGLAGLVGGGRSGTITLWVAAVALVLAIGWGGSGFLVRFPNRTRGSCRWRGLRSCSMTLTPAQERTRLEVMGGEEERPVFDRALADDLRADLERRLEPAVARLVGARALWLTKAKLTNLHARCEGLFVAGELEESVFTYGMHLAVGNVVHKAVETSVYARDLQDVELAERAVDRLRGDDEAFGEYVGLLDQVEQAELIGEAVRQLSWFRATFPPLERAWNPVVEWSLRVPLAQGRVVLSARPDLVLGGLDRDEPMRARRLVLELKGGQERPEQEDDVRFYALVMALCHGVPPFRVVNVNLQAGSCRVQQVTEDLLVSAVRRVADGAVKAAEVLDGREPRLNGGAWCRWCPRSQTCVASTVRESMALPEA